MSEMTQKETRESWEEYSHRLEKRIKEQRIHIDSLLSLRGYPASRRDRKRIASLERLLGQKTFQLEMQDAGLRVLAGRQPRGKIFKGPDPKIKTPKKPGKRSVTKEQKGGKKK